MKLSTAKHLLIATCTAAFLLSGCSDVGDDASTDAVEDEPSEEPTVADEPSPTADDEQGATAGTEEPADGPECLIGDWLISEEQMQQFYDSMDTPADFQILGDTGLSFGERTYEYTPDFTLEMNIAGQEASGTMTGSITGSYSADDGVITTSNEANDINMDLMVGGVAMDGTDIGESFLESSPVNSAPYQCGSSGPVITFENTGDGVDIQLVPRG